jgi:hypothetical protein
MNAVRHGLAARAALLPGETPAELEQLAGELEADLRPAGAAERELVGRVVSLSWRLRRVARAEEAMWDDDDEDRRRGFDVAAHLRERFGYPLMPGQSAAPPDPLTGPSFVAAQFARAGTSALERMAAYEQRLDRALHAALRQLQLLRKLRREAGGDEVPATPTPVVAPTPVAPGHSARNEPSAGPAPDPGASEPASGGAIVQNEPTAEQEPAAPAAPAPDSGPQNARNEPTADSEPGPAPAASGLAPGRAAVRDEPTDVAPPAPEPDADARNAQNEPTAAAAPGLAPPEIGFACPTVSPPSPRPAPALRAGGA